MRPHAAELTAREVMTTDIVRLDAERSLWEALVLMADRQVHHLVVTSGERLVGVVNEFHLLDVWTPQTWDPMSLPVRSLLGDLTAAALPECGLSQIAAIMRDRQVDSVAIVDRAGHILGIVTARDVVRAVAERGIPGDVPAP